jgi:TRAP-type C4-dicarboxylate transport system permease small subunit
VRKLAAKVLFFTCAAAFSALGACLIYFATGGVEVDVRVHYRTIDLPEWKLISAVYVIAVAVAIFSTIVAVALAMTRIPKAA